MPVYNMDIKDVIEEEEGFVRKGGFGEKEDNIEDIVVVANDLCSSMIQTILSVDFEEDINTKSHELMSFEKSIIIKAHLEKKQTRIRLYTKNHEELRIQRVETESPSLSDGVRIFIMMALEIQGWRQDEYRVLRGFLLRHYSINNSASLSNKFEKSYFIIKFGILDLLHHVVSAIADRIRGWGKLIQVMHTKMVLDQVRTQFQAGVQVSRLEDKDVIFSTRSTLEVFILVVFVLDRNIGKIREVLDHCNKVLPELTFAKTNEMSNKEMPRLVNLVVIKDREVNHINAQEMIYKEFSTQELKMIEELFRKHMQHTTLNLYLTTSSTTARKSAADLYKQLYFKMKSTSQDQAADPELWKILKAKFEKQ
uniref:Uncharacterized protein n=1 Tax=Tanacetum cinerariifolium TaxID=118510 RepID=A0A6L2KK85_TANCI|nr:hypothetical protein [Tanacetum cinerariifolium]